MATVHASAPEQQDDIPRSMRSRRRSSLPTLVKIARASC